MSTLLALGVSVRWAGEGPADLTPFLGALAGILVVRFLLGHRLTIITVTVAVLGGTLWAAAIAEWGFSLPTLAMLTTVAVGMHRPQPRAD
ncbi:MAG: hypothetical protein ACRDHJ_00905 [Actinomycetota bacterium]